ncbi:hypothetical protein GGI12_003531 [Dipsacomyces acuminosporus]|nr:hypothetical protein GGI12_003531 [Dipsacomyces acuminosporus]
MIGHNAQAQRNMLLPDLDFSACAASASFVGSHRAGTEPTSKRRLSDESITMDIDAQEDEANQPLKKRLRLLGRSVLDSVVEYSPEWFRSYVEGQKLADRLGQLGYDSHSSTYHGPTREQVKDSMDAEAKRLGKVAVIGIHGWFPTKMLQMVAGEPTGKSEKFCMMMRDALQSYLFEMHGVSVSEEDISLFPLVGEGKIEDRVDLLLSQIIDTEPPQSEPPASEKTRPKPKGKGSSSSSDTPTSKSPSEVIAEALMPARSVRADVLQAADTVFIVTHSQGTPVSALLVEQLMEMGLVDTSRQHVGMLAMAGISHGPLPYLRDNVVIRYIESEAARELFELMDPSSPQSQRYVAALSTILHKGVRLVCIGSWVDEVVPLYSAILQGVSHPNVYRAVYIDAPHYFDDFLTSLIVFALRLRNMGIYDHDLLIHLSEVVAGSLWGHSGHSTVYGEPGVFKLLIKWLLYSTSSVSSSMRSSIDSSVPVRQQMQSISGGQIHMSYRPFNASERLNPFFIPWIMRTLWDDPEIRQSSELRAELKRLVVLFDKWRPETKAGKELKYRLEPVRAAL